MSGEVTSTRAPRVRAARRLTKRALRAADRKFLAEGPQAAREALAAGRSTSGDASATADGVVEEVFLTAETATRHPELGQLADAAGVPVHRVSGEVLSSLAQTVTPQGVVAVCRFVDVPLSAALAGPPRLVAVLANVRDPGNAGTVIRAADAAGAGAVVLADASVDVYNGKCVRASAGSLFHLPVVTGAAMTDVAAAVRAAGLRVLAADGAGERDLDDEADAGALGAPTAWVFGNEAWGLPEDLRALADAVVRVPIHGKAESQNLATAAAVCLYASARAQRRA